MVKQVFTYMVEYTSRENGKDLIPLKTRRKVFIDFQIIFCFDSNFMQLRPAVSGSNQQNRKYARYFRDI